MGRDCDTIGNSKVMTTGFFKTDNSKHDQKDNIDSVVEINYFIFITLIRKIL